MIKAKFCWLWLAAFSLTYAHASRLLLEGSSNNSFQDTCSLVNDVRFEGATLRVQHDCPSVAECCKMCSDDADCFRWTYKPSTKRCALKPQSGWTRKTASGFVSGVVKAPASNRDFSAIEAAPAVAEAVFTGKNLTKLPADGKSFTSKHYADVLGLSWMFYEAQRSGEVPKSNRISWRKSSHLKDLVPGGWYDAGDYLKLNFPLASTVSYLSWGLLEFQQGYIKAGQLGHGMENLKSAVQYLKDCHIAPRKYVGQIGHPNVDHNFWGRADEQTGSRPAFIYDSSMGAADLLGKVSAALASSSLVWRECDPSFAAEILKHAQDLYEWAQEKDGKYSNYYKSATASIYESSDSADDMAWAAYWLYMCTENDKYLEESVKYWKKKDWDVTADWDNSGAAVAVALANLLEDGVNVPNGKEIKSWVVDTFLKSWTKPSGEIKSTPKGMHHPGWSKWGNLQLSTTASFLSLVHAKYTNSASVKKDAVEFARDQVNYALGSSGRSFVVGYGKNPPQFAHHAGASCPDRPARCDWANFESSKPNPQILYGALVAGPEGPGDDTYRDKRDDYVSNEVACDYNSGFTGALAGLVELTN